MAVDARSHHASTTGWWRVMVVLYYRDRRDDLHGFRLDRFVRSNLNFFLLFYSKTDPMTNGSCRGFLFSEGRHLLLQWWE